QRSLLRQKEWMWCLRDRPRPHEAKPRRGFDRQRGPAISSLRSAREWTSHLCQRLCHVAVGIAQPLLETAYGIKVNYWLTPPEMLNISAFQCLIALAFCPCVCPCGRIRALEEFAAANGL